MVAWLGFLALGWVCGLVLFVISGCGSLIVYLLIVLWSANFYFLC